MRNEGSRRSIGEHDASSLVAVVLLALSGCTPKPPDLPPDPPGIETPDEYAFGDRVPSADQRAWKRILDQLEPVYGKGVRVAHRTLRADGGHGAIKTHYEEALVRRHGWREIPLHPAPGSWAFAFESGDRRWVVALKALTPGNCGGGAMPLNILTNLEKTPAR